MNKNCINLNPDLTELKCSPFNYNNFSNKDIKLDTKTNNLYLEDVLIGKLINGKLERIQK